MGLAGPPTETLEDPLAPPRLELPDLAEHAQPVADPLPELDQFPAEGFLSHPLERASSSISHLERRQQFRGVLGLPKRMPKRNYTKCCMTLTCSEIASTARSAIPLDCDCPTPTFSKAALNFFLQTPECWLIVALTEAGKRRYKTLTRSPALFPVRESDAVSTTSQSGRTRARPTHYTRTLCRARTN